MAKYLRFMAAALAVIGASAGANTPAAAPAAPAPDVEAIVSYETRHVMSSGITRVDTWQERLVRRGDQVWTERILPAAVQDHDDDHDKKPEHIGHKHFNGDTAARWLRLQADGKVDVKYVDREHRAVVAIPRAEYGTVGFDGSWAAAANIVPAMLAKSMKAGSSSGEAQWRTDRRDGWSHRVLWSESRQLAMKVESVRDDGTVRRLVTVQLKPVAAKAPWDLLAGYAQKRYDDFMD